MIYYFVEFAGSFANIALLVLFVDRLFQKKDLSSRWFYLYIALLIVGQCFLSLFPTWVMPRTIYFLLGGFLLAILFYEAQIWQAIFASAAFFTLVAVVEVLTMLLIGLQVSDTDALMQAGSARLIYVVFSNLIQIPLLILISHFFSRKENVLRILWLLPIIAIQIASIAVCYMVQYHAADENFPDYLIGLMVVLLLMNILIVFYQGARSDLTSSQVGMKLQALDIVGQEAGDSRNQVHRFIRLTNLIPELLDMVDEKKISFNPAVELSYLDESQQRDFLEAMADTQNAPSLSQAQRLKKLAQEGHFSYDVAFAVMGEPKKDELDKVVIKNDTLRKYFPESSTPREMEEKIIGLLEESKTEKVVFRSDSIKKYFPSNYSSEQIENSILKMLDQRMKKRKHEAER